MVMKPTFSNHGQALSLIPELPHYLKALQDWIGIHRVDMPRPILHRAFPMTNGPDKEGSVTIYFACHRKPEEIRKSDYGYYLEFVVNMYPHGGEGTSYGMVTHVPSQKNLLMYLERNFGMPQGAMMDPSFYPKKVMDEKVRMYSLAKAMGYMSSSTDVPEGIQKMIKSDMMTLVTMLPQRLARY
jgi:hypothetical protein